MMEIFMLFVGFLALLKGADILVDGSSSLASKMGISDLIIGLTVVSIGTSMPELIVNIIASIEGNSAVAIGNVLGSNIANFLLILGITALIMPLPVRRSTVFSEIPYSIAAVLLVGFLANANVWGEEDKLAGLCKQDGILILVFFFVFFAYIYITAKEDKENQNDLINVNLQPIWKDISFIFGGMILLFIGGKYVVEGAVFVAKIIGMSETFISLTVVAIGTSLPELVTSISAAKKGNIDVAVGNVVGSNIFNLLWILGLSATIHPIPFDKIANHDLLAVVLATLLGIMLMIVSKKAYVLRWHGFVLVSAYVAYVTYIYIRG